MSNKNTPPTPWPGAVVGRASADHQHSAAQGYTTSFSGPAPCQACLIEGIPDDLLGGWERGPNPREHAEGCLVPLRRAADAAVGK